MIPLKEAGMKVSIPEPVEHWYELVEYAKKDLSLVRASYLFTWHKIFAAPRSKGWSDVLLRIRLLYTVRVSNTKLEGILLLP